MAWDTRWGKVAPTACRLSTKARCGAGAAYYGQGPASAPGQYWVTS